VNAAVLNRGNRLTSRFVRLCCCAWPSIPSLRYWASMAVAGQAGQPGNL